MKDKAKTADLAAFAVPGRVIAVRVTPRASRNQVSATVLEDGSEGLRVSVTTVPEDGKANAAVVKLMAKALGIAPSRLVLLRGATGRDKLFRVE